VNYKLDNIIFSLQKAGGISVYWYELSHRLLSHSNNVTFVEDENARNNIFRDKLQLSPDLLQNDRKFGFGLSRYLSPPVDLSPGTIFHSSYYRTQNDPNSVNIITVYDFIYERFRSGLACLVHHNQKKKAIRKADGIICISNSTKRDLLNYFPETPPNIIKTIHLSASGDYKQLFLPEDISPDFDELLSKKVILFVGERSGYKNFDIAVETVRRSTDFLVTVGGKPFAKDEQARIVTALNGRFRHYPKLDNNKLNQLYNLALCLLYPSSYEGFGIPALEAMQAGCPVIAADSSSLPEVCGDAGLMVTEISAEGFVERVAQLANPDFRSQVIERGLRQAALFSWDRTFSETIDFYEQIRKQKFSFFKD
jgi:glycosyltransferase involved in cell wall biosynthesis